ncbi:MAG: hydrogenase nickel incorporation protein HypB [Marinilabiliaceae bacterium]|nr:hydrogenase nickel incorporation protein HypB [Marinilabiliaceae bacterium]
MCDTCGCGSEQEATTGKSGEPIHHHPHDHPHQHVVEVNKNLLHDNDLMAERNRGYFEAKNILAINLVSSPGSGKTTLLEKTISALNKELSFYVIAGDQQTSNDANRIQQTGAQVMQVNTGTGCHLDANMVHNALKKLNPPDQAMVMIENVGNLVCPALFDLGEAYRMVMVSVTEGEDKPLKYPHMFASAHICIINKTDLLPHLSFDIDQLRENIKQVNHHLEVFELSTQTGEGLKPWLDWLEYQQAAI